MGVLEFSRGGTGVSPRWYWSFPTVVLATKLGISGRSTFDISQKGSSKEKTLNYKL